MKPFTEMLIHVKHLEGSLVLSKCLCWLLFIWPCGHPSSSHHSFSHLFSAASSPGKGTSLEDYITHVPLPASFSMGSANGRKCQGTRRLEEREDREFLPAPFCLLLWQQSSPSITKLHRVALPPLYRVTVCSHGPWSPGRLMPSLCGWSLSAPTSHFCFLNSSQISVSSPFIKIYSLKSVTFNSPCTLSPPRELLKTTNAWAFIPRDWCNRPGVGSRHSCCLRALQVMEPELRTIYWKHLSGFCFLPRCRLTQHSVNVTYC